MDKLWFFALVLLIGVLALGGCRSPSAPVPSPSVTYPAPTRSMTAPAQTTSTPPPLGPTKTSSPTVAQEPASTPTNVARAVMFITESAYRDRSKYVHVIGEVRNDTTDNVRQVKITASLLDSQRRPAVTRSNFASLSLLEPGQSSPFDVIFPGFEIVPEYQLDLSWETTTEISKTKLQIRQTSTQEKDGFYWLNGEVRNAGPSTAEEVMIVASFYSDSGRLVAVGSGFPDVVPLSAGMSSPFTLAIEAPDTKISGSLIQAEGY